MGRGFPSALPVTTSARSGVIGRLHKLKPVINCRHLLSGISTIPPSSEARARDVPWCTADRQRPGNHPGATELPPASGWPRQNRARVPQPSEVSMQSAGNDRQVRLERVTASCCRVVLDNPPVNVMGPRFVLQMRDVVTALENDDQTKVVIFQSAVDGFFLNHSDFRADLENLTNIPQGPTGLE